MSEHNCPFRVVCPLRRPCAHFPHLCPLLLYLVLALAVAIPGWMIWKIWPVVFR